MPAGYQIGRIKYWTVLVTAGQAEYQIAFSATFPNLAATPGTPSS
jgi:hypothetical protein